MKQVSNEQMAKKIAEESKQYFYHDEYECGLACAKRMAKLKDKQHEQEKQQMIERTIDWVQKEATKHIGFNAVSEECSLSWDFTDLLVKAMKGE